MVLAKNTEQNTPNNLANTVNLLTHYPFPHITMSTSSVRRLKDHGGGGSKITATAVTTKPARSITPVSEKIITRNADSVKKLAEKENAGRPTSRIRAAAVDQKPVMKPMARVDKSTACTGDGSETRARWSMSSSVPRGRSCSPSDFVRNRGSRVSVGEIDRSRVSEMAQAKKSAFRDSDVSENVIRNSRVGSGKSIEIRKEIEVKNGISGSRVLDVVKINSIRLNLESLNLGSHLDSGVKGFGGVRVFENSKSGKVEKREDVVRMGLRESVGKSLNRSSGLESNREKGVKEESAGASTVNKYSSKLHEKLAFLEGKVKRIALDITRTEEMLDMNNPDASKVLLSDIQETVAGIEKAIGQKSGLGKLNENDDNLQINLSEKCPSKEADDTKSTLKGLNNDELEARFFPHHKLLRDRTSLKEFSRNHQICETKIEKPTSELKLDENLTEIECLASLNKEKSVIANLEIYEVQANDEDVDSAAPSSSDDLKGRDSDAFKLTTGETQEDLDVQENVQDVNIEEETEDICTFELNEIGNKTCTGGWFVSEGESALLAYGDGSCSFYDIVNCEEKIEYKPPFRTLPNLWQDCWILRAPTSDGCSGKYVVAASAGNTLVSGYCSWDFYTKDVVAENTKEDRVFKFNKRTALAPLPNNNPSSRRKSSSTILTQSQWWYKPCGPLIVWTGTYKKLVTIHDIRDGEHILKWDLQKPVLAMEYSSPLQWRSRGKVVIAEGEGISLWDVSNLDYKALLSVSSAGSKISALHVNNTDAEMGGGVRQRVSSSEAEGNDGVFCTDEAINVLDFRIPSGIGLNIPKMGTSVQSIFSRGDSIYLGCTELGSTTKKQSNSLIQQFSVRKQKLFSTYTMPESNQNTDITQVWGNSNLVMGVCKSGLSIFDALKDDDDAMKSVSSGDYGNVQKVKEVIGPNGMRSPSFDYLGSRVLFISRNRPAQWRYLL